MHYEGAHSRIAGAVGSYYYLRSVVQGHAGGPSWAGSTVGVHFVILAAMHACAACAFKLLTPFGSNSSLCLTSPYTPVLHNSFIGTLPEVRGKGYGSLLLRTMTRRADAEGRVCMLEVR